MSTAAVPRKNPGGRRPGASGTRDAILDAAIELFAQYGYESASMRAIAGKAGVDPALIRHFFGDKESLFAAAVADRTSIPQRIAEAVGSDLSMAGRAVTDAYLRLWEDDDTRPVLLALVRSATTSERVAHMLREILISRAREESGFDPERTKSVALAAAHLFGVAFARNVIHVQPLVDMSREELVDRIAPTVQAYLNAAPDPDSRGAAVT